MGSSKRPENLDMPVIQTPKGENMLSYKSNPKLKRMMVTEMKLHRKNDQIIKGTYSKMNGIFKGCAVGCSIHSLNVRLKKNLPTNQHSIYESELGLPEWLARLEDFLFESLPDEEAKNFPVDLLTTIPVGVDLDPVQYRFKKFLLQDNFDCVHSLKDLDVRVKLQVTEAIKLVMKVIEGTIETGKVDEAAARSARSAAESAARSARSAAESAGSARWAARSATIIRYKDELLRLLKEVN